MVSKPVYREQSEALLSDQGVPSNTDCSSITRPPLGLESLHRMRTLSASELRMQFHWPRLDTSVRTLPPHLPSRNMVLSLA
jgi:hypothetical protein